MPLLTSSRGAIVNNVSMIALATLPITPAYVISKTARVSTSMNRCALVSQDISGPRQLERS